jgi:hypothetical protein
MVIGDRPKMLREAKNFSQGEIEKGTGGHGLTSRGIAAIFVTGSVIRKNLIPPRAARHSSASCHP